MSWLFMTSVGLAVSAILNIFVIWYSIKLIRELVSVTSTVEEVFSDIDAFVKHLSGVYQLETFYGDQTLENLLSHAAMLKEEIEKYKLSFSLIEEGEENENDERFSPISPP